MTDSYRVVDKSPICAIRASPEAYGVLICIIIHPLCCRKMVYKVVQFNVKRTAECLKECFLCYSVSIAVYEECWIHLGNGIDDSDKVYFVHS